MGYHILVLAGGSGTRLWPLSRAAIPKHLLPLDPDGHTLLRATVERVLPLADSIRIVTAAGQADACRAALTGLDLGADPVIAEPEARGTGPALALANRWIAGEDPGAVISSVHADHHIVDSDGYRAAILGAAGWAEATQGLATVGVTPTHPATGLGYVALDRSRSPDAAWSPPTGNRAETRLLEAAAALPAHRAAGFVEKPPLDLAERFVREGQHLWNTGLFAWPAPVFEAEVAAADPGLAERIAEVARRRRLGDETAASAGYAAIPPAPVDTLVFERTRHLTVVQADFGWSDLGSFPDLLAARREAGEADPSGNVVEGDVVAIGASTSFVLARGGRPIVVVGIEGLVVVDAGDTVLVVPADQAQRVKEVVDRLREEGRSELL